MKIPLINDRLILIINKTSVTTRDNLLRKDNFSGIFPNEMEPDFTLCNTVYLNETNHKNLFQFYRYYILP